MDEYKLSPKEIYQILKNKGIEYLHHANTVATSITFIENRALLSRHYVEANGYYQTPQKSDSEDKKYDVWDSVFLDGEDLHKRYNQANRYGPILFKLKLEILNSPFIQGIYVTKNNPWYWKDYTKPDEKFYKSAEEVNRDYLTGKKVDSRIMFTIRSPNNEIKLNKFLHSIEIDIPKLLVNVKAGGEMSVGDYAINAIQESLSLNGLGHIRISKRHDGEFRFCKCNLNYNILQSFEKKEFRKRFAKKD
ncbi:hypothetical protein J3D55_001606 [Chryseobacterium ginsenosidimutans]|uniref:hypothetical protein n=1 Tax=Chryseobacterium ginsenosidimutans TaxID=687846 RepID=UPI002167945D|nr:hypothetical protein [Chryseobacterium ginsenosidimutans]MCS3868690.1 hypothetical protein [Chryseobacterium ginsenosidimutans]